MSLIQQLLHQRNSPFDPPFFNDLFTTSEPETIRLDWKETPEAHVFLAELPGVAKSDVKVEVEDGRVLKIAAERHHDEESKDVKWHCNERSVRKFYRSFRLPDDAKAEGIKATMENGVLTLVVLKEKEKEKKRGVVRSVEISGDGNGHGKGKKDAPVCCGFWHR